jgi:hypothetical protein
MPNEIKRKEFLGVIGKGAIASAVLSFLPVKIFSFVSKALTLKKPKTNKSKIKITINPSAVKRNKG